MVQAQFARGKPLAAVLAKIAVAREDIASIEPHALFWHAIVMQEPQYAWHLNLEAHRLNPILVRFLELGRQFADLAPRFKIVISPLAILDLNHLRQPAEQQHKGTSHIDDVNGYIL